MAMAARIAMPTDADVLTLAQWFSPAFPVGAFSYSHGLEWAVEAGQVETGAQLSAWIEEVLRHGAGRSDALFLAASYLADTDHERAALDATCRAFATSAERLTETLRQGAAFGRAVAAGWDLPMMELAYPIAAGRAARHCELPPVLTGGVYLHAFASNLVGAGQRLIRLGQSEAQVIIASLAPLCSGIAKDSQGGTISQISGTAFLAEIAAMQHETQHSRIFQT